MYEEAKKRRISVYLRADVINAVTALAAAQNRSLSNMIDQLLSDAVDYHRSENDLNIELSGRN